MSEERPIEELHDIIRRLFALGFVRTCISGDPADNTINAMMFSVGPASEKELAKAVVEGRAEALVAPERQ